MDTGGWRRLTGAAVLGIAAAAGAPALDAGQADDPPALTRLRACLDTYEPQLGELIADERFEQRYQVGVDSDRRLLMSEVGFLRLPGDLEWIDQRQVTSIDGRAVRRPAGSLAEQLVKPTDMARALAIAAENARSNLGRPRSINVPTLPLDLLFLNLRGTATYSNFRRFRTSARLVPHPVN